MELFRLLGTLAIDTAQAQRDIDAAAARAEAGSNKTDSAFKKIGESALTIGKTVLSAGAVLGGAWIAAIESSREYRTEMGKLDTAFVTSGHSSDAAKKTYSDLNAVLGDSGQATEAAQHLAMLTDNEKDLQTWTDICTGVYAKFGESIPIESLTESANEVAKSGELTGGLVDALVWAGIGEEEFQEQLDACSTEQERQKLIMDTLSSVGNTLLGGGEAGAEAIAPIDVLQDYVRAAVRGENEGVRKTLIEQMQLLIDFLARSMPHGVRLDSGVLVGELTPAIDMQLSDRWNHSRRGNTR